MLSKNNKILIGCLALLLVMSVGYALFSDTITVTGTATAKGEFNITPTCISGMVLDLGFADSGYKNDYCVSDDETDTVSFGTEFEYPGATKSFTVKFTNTGSINSTLSLEIPLANGKLCFANSLDKDAETEGKCTELLPDYTNKLAGYGIQIGDGEIYKVQSAYGFSQLPVDVQLAFSENGKIVLKPGNSVYYWVSFGATDIFSENNVLNQHINYSYNATFEQAAN